MQSALASLENKIKLSPGERKLISLLPPSGKRITTEELAEKFYEGKQQPFNSRIVIVGMIRNVQRKISRCKRPPLYVHRSERAGPYSIEVWRSGSAAP